MGLANVYLYTKFEISSYPFQMYSIVSLNGWVRDGVCPNSRVDLRRFFYPIPNKFGVNIVEWPMFNANVLDFWYVFALSNYGANSCELARKMVQILGFSAPVRFRGTSKKSV